MAWSRDAYEMAEQQGHLWTPYLAMDSLAMWLEVAELDTLTCDSSSRITAWADRLGQRTAQGDAVTGTNRPALIADGAYSRVDFSASPLQFLGLNSSISYNGSNGLTIVAVSERCKGGSVGTIVGQTNGGPQFRWNTSAGTVEGLRAAQASLITSTATAPTTGLHVVSARFATSYCEVAVNGSRNSNTTNPSFSQPIVAVGSRNASAGDESMQGGLAAVLVWQRLLGLDELAQAEGCLSWLHDAQASLAADHPYRNAPPLIGG